MKQLLVSASFFLSFVTAFSQTLWINVDSAYGPLPSSFHVYRSNDSIEGKPSIAYCVKVQLQDRKLLFNADTSYQRRLTPSQFYTSRRQPLLVVNGTFFDFASNRNLNAVVRDGKLIAYNVHTTALRGKDTGWYYKVAKSAIGIYGNRKADVAWIYTDSGAKKPFAFQGKPSPWKDNSNLYTKEDFERHFEASAAKWKVRTAIGGGPVLVQNGKAMITNDEERMFMGKAEHDRHPRTAMGYTADGDLVILVVEGRNPGVAEGASLVHLAELLIRLGCVEALNLDGGGSSCLLINGKQTIKPSDKEGERAVPAVFIVAEKR